MLAYFLTKSPKTRVLGDTIGLGFAFLFSLVFGFHLASSREMVPASLSMLSFVMVHKHDSFICGCIRPCNIVASAVA
ncbi:hypothetical protein Bca4012_036666 [Brassica carinata]